MFRAAARSLVAPAARRVAVAPAPRLTPSLLAQRFYASSSLSQDTIKARIEDVLKSFEKVDSTKLTPTASFTNDLGLDSLDAVEVVMAIEEEFAIEIPDEEADRITTVGEAIDYISKTPEAQCVVAETKERVTHRNGKRVKAAKELYGEVETIGSPKTPPSSSVPFTSSSAANVPHISYSSADTRLGTIELKENFMSNLLDSFFTFRSVTVFDGDVDFRTAFDLAGRRIDQLSDANQVLCAAYLAIGARCTDHPGLLGPNAPRLSDLRDITRSVDRDLSPYGQARAEVCKELTVKALALADEKGLFRKASPEGVAALLLIENLLPLPADGPASVGTYFAHIYNHQVRELLTRAQNDPEVRQKVQGTVLSWTAYTRDALVSAFLGQSATFSDDELWLLRSEEDAPPGLPEELLRPLSPSHEQNYWRLLTSFVHWVTDLARETPAGLTSVRAMKAPRMNEAFAAEFVKRIRVAMETVPELKRRMQLLKGGQRFLRDAATLVRGLRLSAVNLSFLLKRVVDDRIAARPAGIISDLGALAAPSASSQTLPDQAYWDRLAILQREANFQVFLAAREIVSVLKETLQAGIPLGSHEWLDLRSIQLMFTRLSLWMRAILDQPSQEEGGLDGFTIDDKLHDLRWTARAIRSIGWSFAELATALPWVLSEITNLEARRALFYPTAPTTAADGIDFDSLLSQLSSASPDSSSFSPLSSAFSPGVPSTPHEFTTPAEFDALLTSLGEETSPLHQLDAMDSNPNSLGIGAAVGATAIPYGSRPPPL
ncbi:mitochondrial acyl carrier protein [Rhodotorula toruloides]